MKKALVILVAIALVVWVVSWFRTPAVVATAGAQSWPGRMGTLDAALDRYPPRKANDAVRKLLALAKTLPRNDSVLHYVEGEVSRGELTIGAPPVLPDVVAIRELLLREPLVWSRAEGVGGGEEDSNARGAQMTIARALVTNALSKARANDAAAWEDLRAVWTLARSLDDQPQMMTQTAAFSMARMINAVAWKMPLPTPPWFAEVQQRDDVRRLVEAFQYQVASYWDSGARTFPTKFLADSIEKDRGIAESLVRETRCDVAIPMNDLGTDLSGVWHRAFRARAEREATANALRIREGKTIEATSRCSDEGWTFDGTTLRAAHEISPAPPDKPMPLALRVAARGPR
ncbi:MAG: hypothetical protein JOZ54_08000 [Acidobacteria bacterium]|nr:hypothetical protein [Acidobacteriota bacterium]